MPLLRCLVLGTSLLAGACARRPGAAALPPTASPTNVAAAAGPRLLFFSGRLSAAGPTRLTVLQLQAVPGALKQLPAEAPGPDCLLLTQLAAGGQTLAQVRLPHPLHPDVEHVAADQRSYERSQLSLPEAEFFTRLPLLPGAATLRVTEVLAKQSFPLADLPLPAATP